MPMNANTVLTDAERQRIEQAIAEAERHTSAEIVCTVATESGRYDRAESLVGLAGALLGLSLAHAAHAWTTAATGNWTASALPLGWQALAVVLGFIAGSVLASYVHPLRRLLVSERELDQEVRRAAAHVFALASVASTTGRTGLLIYVSLFERRVMIRADEQVRQALGDDVIAQLRDRAVQDLRQGTVASTFLDLIEQVQAHLAERLPADRELAANELANHVLSFHPRPANCG